MAQIATMTLADASAVSHTFTPMYSNGLSVTYTDLSGSSAALCNTIGMQMRQPKAGVARKVTLRVAVPFEETADDITTVNNCSAFVDIVVPATATEGTIEDLRSFLVNALAEAQFTDAVDDGAFPY